MPHDESELDRAAARGADVGVLPSYADVLPWLGVVAGMVLMLAPLLVLGADAFLEVPSWLVNVAVVLILPGVAAFTYFSYGCAKAQGLSTGRVMWLTVTAPIRFLWNIP